MMISGLISGIAGTNHAYAQSEDIDVDVRITHVDRTGSDVRVWVKSPSKYTLTWNDGNTDAFRRHLMGKYTVTVMTEDGQCAKRTIMGVDRQKLWRSRMER